MTIEGTKPGSATAATTSSAAVAAPGDISRSIFAHAGVALIATALDGTITAFNPAAEELLGYSEAEMVGRATPVVFHDPDEVAARAARLTQDYGEPVSGFGAFVRPLEDQVVHTHAWTYLHKDGRRVPVLLTVSTLKDESGMPVGYLGVARDRSDYFKQRAREQAAADMADIVRASQEQFIAGVPPTRLFADLLDRMLRFTGSEYGFIGEVLRDGDGRPYMKTHAITNIAWSPETEALYEANRSQGFEFRNLKTLFGAALTSNEPVIANDAATDPRRGGLPPGHPAMRSFLGLPCFYGGEMIGLVGLANREAGYPRDLVDLVSPLASSTASLIQATRLEVERQVSAATLAEKENRLRSILETAADCFIEVGPDGLVTEWNRLAEASLRVPRHQAIGRHVDEVLHLRRPSGEATGLLDTVPGTGAEARPREVVVCMADGANFAAELVIWAVPSSGGAGYCAFLRNIDERKRLEEQERLLFQSETLLKEVNHRIKNNMQVISSLLSIQSTKLEGDRQRAVFLECRERIRAMSLIHDRLYSTGNYAQIDFADYLREMLSLTVSSNKPDCCDVEIALEARPLRVEVDHAVPLSLIASELVLNSLKHGFIDRDRGRILVRLERSGDECELFVGDDGPGPAPGDAGGRGTGLQLIDSLTRQIRGVSSFATRDGLPGVSIRWSER
ncbi:MAG: PAS domain S-box protein [Planctomycetaceae bacterium]